VDSIDLLKKKKREQWATQRHDILASQYSIIGRIDPGESDVKRNQIASSIIVETTGYVGLT